MPGGLGSRALKVRPDVFFVRSEDGVWLRNNVGSFFVKGPKSYALVRSLLTQLDGTRTVDDVFQALDPAQRAALHDRLLEPLVRRGFLFEARAEPVPPWMALRYRDHLAFLEQYVERPVERLLSIRSQPVVCIGSGVLLRAVTVALAELSFARVHVYATDVDACALREIVDAIPSGDGGAEWKLTVHPPTVSLEKLVRAAAEPRARGAVLATAEAGYAEVAAAAAFLSSLEQAVAIVAPAGGVLGASPVLSVDPWCWECLYRGVVSDDSVASAPPSAALAAFQVVQRLFCRLAGPPVPEDRHFTTVDCRTLTVQAHTPRRHAACGRHHIMTRRRVLRPLGFDDVRVRPDVPTAHDPAESVAAQDRIVETVAAWTNRVTGPLLAVGEEDLSQMPLSASCCRIRAPESMPGAPDVRTVVCRAVAPREARNQVVLLALEWLAGATAELWNEHEDLVALGAGWSTGEAVYRACAAAALSSLAPGGTMPDHCLMAGRFPESPIRTFLLQTLADLDCGRVDAWVEQAPIGLVVARAVARGETLGWGVGVDDLHAFDQALADAVARRTSQAAGDVVATAYLAPPAGRWADVLPRIRGCERLAVLDMGHLLPFLDERACVVGLVLNANARGEAGE